MQIVRTGEGRIRNLGKHMFYVAVVLLIEVYLKLLPKDNTGIIQPARKYLEIIDFLDFSTVVICFP